ncbi:hypothetical protein CHELA20_54408 [Hyphomicrobiales bacterium]|nr:hypothetical protein CHELA41_20520 [Hyphomicrobiales bacterium]CAH1686204.1 hypothetical protein CHELA20_54408 [Hyphomicrobiales bacterium]
MFGDPRCPIRAFLVSRRSVPDYGTSPSPKGTSECFWQRHSLARVSKRLADDLSLFSLGMLTVDADVLNADLLAFVTH